MDNGKKTIEIDKLFSYPNIKLDIIYCQLKIYCDNLLYLLPQLYGIFGNIFIHKIKQENRIDITTVFDEEEKLTLKILGLINILSIIYNSLAGLRRVKYD